VQQFQTSCGSPRHKSICLRSLPAINNLHHMSASCAFRTRKLAYDDAAGHYDTVNSYMGNLFPHCYGRFVLWCWPVT
jgi:hypothetical protein